MIDIQEAAEKMYDFAGGWVTTPAITIYRRDVLYSNLPPMEETIECEFNMRLEDDELAAFTEALEAWFPQHFPDNWIWAVGSV